ncbi:MAG: hypothetical protein IPJ84_09575 [Bdellovibrionales bacterium]|nr:hypothetical protein [Bdellovibrionales bacterium]
MTGGSDAKASRLAAEMSHIGLGLPYTAKTRELLPKYALQVFNSGKMGHYSLPLQYGNVMFRFKPHVKKRSTWSARDSLGMSGIEVPLRTNSIRAHSGAKCNGYCEAQVWGDLDRADVASIVVPEGLAITDEMKRFNVPVYTYKQDEKCKYVWGGPIVPGCERAISIAGVELSKKPAYTPENKSTDVKTAPAVQSIDAVRDLEGRRRIR